MKFGIFGYGGHAREVASQMKKDVSFFVDDEFVNEKTIPVSKFNPDEYQLIVAVADPVERKKIIERLPKNTKYFTFVHPTAQIMSDNIEIGEGSFIGANSILTLDIRIGKHAILNRGNQIGHDARIGDFFSAMPGSIVSGNVEIGDLVYLGSNSTIKEKIKITNSVTVGSNATVVKNIEHGGVYVGVPVKKIK